MKKITLIVLLFCCMFSAWAQLPNGTVAPDFTVTDINGNSHTLSTYLNAGKSVILDFSGTDCGPCWKYHETQALQDFYNAYGPPGSNEVMVLHLESNYDGNAPGYNSILTELFNADGKGLGNWVQGTPFPIAIFNYGTINVAYEVTYVPTVFLICASTGTVKQMVQPSAYSIKNTVNTNCGTLTGVQNYMRVLGTENGFCSTQGSFKAKVKNYGSNNVTTAVFKLKENGNVVATKTVNAQIEQFNPPAGMTITFDAITVNPSATYTVEIESVNGVSNYKPEFSVANLPFHISNPTGHNLQVKIHTDECPALMSWNIVNSAGTIIANDGPYLNGSSCGGPPNSIVTKNVTLPVGNDCYTLNLLSSGSYGWDSNSWITPDTVTPGIEIYSGGNLVYSKLNVGNFGSKLTVENFLSTTTLTTDVPESDPFNIYPNPSTGIITINSSENVFINVIDLMGKNYFSGKVANKDQIDLCALSDGIYIVQSKDLNNAVTNQKLIISH